MYLSLFLLSLDCFPVAGQEVPWKVVAHVEGGPVQYPYVGVLFEEGPSDIKAVYSDGWWTWLSEGQKIGYNVAPLPVNPCGRLDLRSYIRGFVFPRPGTYRFRLLSGYYDEQVGKQVIQDSKPVAVEVSPPSGVTARLSALLPPAAAAGGTALLLLALRVP